MARRKLCVVTGSRAEYGLLRLLMGDIKSDPELRLQLIVTGMHLSPEFGLTFRQIENDGFRIDQKVEMLLSSDTPVGIAKSIGVGTMGFADAFEKLRPDCLVVLGDRFEVFSACTAALAARIPIAHIHGGESTEGLIDESIRHAITKMSHLHFVAAKIFQERVIQLGEAPDRVFCVGAPGLDNIRRTRLLPKATLEKEIGFRFGKLTFLVTFHPVTLERNSSEKQFRILLEALDQFPEAKLIFTKPNADTDGRIITQLIDQYVGQHKERAASFTSLGQKCYLSTLKYIDVIIGNSSSGLIEAPSFAIPTINIGDRQRGRLFAKSVINTRVSVVEISRGIRRSLSPLFRESLGDLSNPYGDGRASPVIKNILKKAGLGNLLIKKRFFDLSFDLPSL